MEEKFFGDLHSVVKNSKYPVRTLDFTLGSHCDPSEYGLGSETAGFGEAQVGGGAVDPSKGHWTYETKNFCTRREFYQRGKLFSFPMPLGCVGADFEVPRV